ncbi:MAG: formate C-acetyltransferase/glycerol dehydratase family glycyl radical enzyme, partial [candidate division WOR-3 bacterium]
MNERIAKLRSKSLRVEPYVSAERARLLTEFYEKNIAERVSMPVARALAFEHILKNKRIFIDDDELIVGERGPAPKATPTYPEICIHSLADLDILNSREKVAFRVDKRTRKIYKDRIIPFWKGRSIRERIFSETDEAWQEAYRAGVFTEFMEQRAPGHTVLDDKIYKQGLLEFKKKIQERLRSLDFYGDIEALDKREELTAMSIAIDALLFFARRCAGKIRRLIGKTRSPIRRRELKEMARICDWVPGHAPRSFWEALQYYWFVHLGVITEFNTWDSFNPGRLDQHLYPFYRKDIASGVLTKERASELLQAFWIKFNNQPAPPKVGVTAQESNTYTDFCLINLGGLKPDGSNAVNELSYMMLDVIEEMRILQPSSMVQVSSKNPDKFLERALRIVRTGFGQPSIFNADEIVQEMVRQGKSVVDARNGGASGCVETGAFGKESYILTGYFNLVKILEITLNNGKDPLTNRMLGLRTGKPISFRSFNELFSAYERQLNHFIDIKIKGNMVIERIYAKYMPAVFLSTLIDDCIARGKDYHNGGARYNTSYIQGVGIGSITDSLTSIKFHVFDKKDIGMPRLLKALRKDFKGFERVRCILWDETPKYGNDDDYADKIMKQIFEIFFHSVDGRPNAKGGHFRINLLPTTVHVYFGSKVGATADGRRAYTPLSEGISPVQGTDKNGPTSVIKSAAKMDHVRTGGTLLNQKFTPQLLAGKDGIRNLVALIRAYFNMNGHHIQFN